LIRTATPRRQNPLDSQGARTPMNGEPRTDLLQLIARPESLLGHAEVVRIKCFGVARFLK
jgi:hypothetical protein